MEWKNTCPRPPRVFFTGNPLCFDAFSDILLHLGEAGGKPRTLGEGPSYSTLPEVHPGRLGCGIFLT